MKSTRTYWNPLASDNSKEWEFIEGTDRNLLQLTIAEDPETGDYTRLSSVQRRFLNCQIRLIQLDQYQN